MSTPSPSTTSCPSCGVAVTLGYTRCPRCHAPMPSGRHKRESMQAGGTTVAPEVGSGGTVWLAAGAAVVVGVIVAVIVLAGGKHKKAAAAEEPEEELTEGSEVIAPEAPPEPPVAPVRLDPLGAADRLERALATERYFAKSTLRGELLELRSEFCAQARLRAIIAGAAVDLRAQGIATIRCVELHGAEVFSQPVP